MLDGSRVQGRADFLQKACARCMFVDHHAYFDQFVAGQVLVDFIEHRCGQSGVADHYYRVQAVGAGAQCAALG